MQDDTPRSDPPPATPSPGYPPPGYGQAPGYPPPGYGQAPGYPPGYPPPGYPAPQVYMMAAPQQSTFAILALIFGITALVGLGIIGGILAIVFAGNADREIAASGGWRTGSDLARIGRILGWVGIGLWSAFIVLYILFFVGFFAVMLQSIPSSFPTATPTVTLAHWLLSRA